VEGQAGAGKFRRSPFLFLAFCRFLKNAPLSLGSDVPDWRDQDGDDCETWESNGWCALYGDEYSDTSGRTANEACCACGGVSIWKSSAEPSVQ